MELETRSKSLLLNLFLLQLITSLLVGCGVAKKLLGGDTKITTSPGGSGAAEQVVDPAQYWLNLGGYCSRENPIYEWTLYNINDKILAESACTFNAATNVSTMNIKNASTTDISKLEEIHYEETEFNAANRPTKKSTWSASDKKELRSQTIASYDQAGHLTSAVTTADPNSPDSKIVVSYTFLADEEFGTMKTETYTGGKVTKIEESNCYESYYPVKERACEEKLDGQVIAKWEQDGTDMVRKELIKGTFTETVRKSQLSGFGSSGWEKITEKHYNEDTGALSYSMSYTCTGSGDTRDCTESWKQSSGLEYSSSTITQLNTLSYTQIVGKMRTEQLSLTETSSSFKIDTYDNTNVSGTVKLLTEPKGFARNSEYSVSVTIKPATNNDGPSSYPSFPDKVSEIWKSDFTAGTINYKVKETYDEPTGTTQTLIYDITGITTQQINERQAIKTVTVSQ